MDLKGMVIGNQLKATEGAIYSKMAGNGFVIWAHFPEGDGLSYARVHNKLIENLEARIKELEGGLKDIKKHQESRIDGEAEDYGLATQLIG